MRNSFSKEHSTGHPPRDAGAVHSAQKMRIGSALILLAVVTFSACSDKKIVSPPPEPPAVFSRDVLPIFNRSCNRSGCHISGDTLVNPSRFFLDSFDSLRFSAKTLLAEKPDHPVIIPGLGVESHLVLHLLGIDTPLMPLGGPPLPRNEIKKVIQWINEGARGDNGEPFYDPAGKIYVANSGQGTVTVIDPDLNLILKTIPVARNPNNAAAEFAHHFAWNFTDNFLYLTMAGQLGELVKIDPGSDQIVARLAVGVAPTDVRISPDGRFAYVANHDLNPFLPRSTVTKINLTTFTVAGTITVGKAPHGLRMSQDGRFMLACNYLTDDVTFIYLNTNGDADSTFTLKLGSAPKIFRPYGIGFSPDDSLAFVSCQQSNEVRVVDLKNRLIVDSIPVGFEPFMVERTPDNRFLYVPCRQSDAVYIIRLSDRTVVKSVGVGFRAHGVDFSPDGLRAYITCEGDHINPSFIYVINAVTQRIIGPIEVGVFPNGVLVSPLASTSQFARR